MEMPQHFRLCNYNMLTAITYQSLTTERAADVDSNRPHVGFIRIADTVVERDEDAACRKQQTEGKKAYNQTL